ncbi:MAG: N-acetylglucosamine-6-phosphate deacetylase, partial [Alphaproteobacteria bacterium]|nr:N-acetylglucosamine-6-phosphate deacetylase [Alphaproteobacteria bacterium]
MQVAVAADHVFDGTSLRDESAVIIHGSRIRAVIDRSEVPAAIPSWNLPPGAWLAPGFIDIQVNGGGDVLFNDDP